VIAGSRAATARVADLPGKSDLANKRWRWAIFVHGCFLARSRRLRTRIQAAVQSWLLVRKARSKPDARCSHHHRLRELGYDVLTVWECDTRSDVRLNGVVAAFFNKLVRGCVVLAGACLDVHFKRSATGLWSRPRAP
jgi:DNA mismatch endonuclease (patch repair protein)